MKSLRWIVFSPLSLSAFIGCLYVVPSLLAWVLKILYYVMFLGSKYDAPPFFDFEYAIDDFKAFIFTTCLGTIISGCISGAIAGWIAPASSKPKIALAVYVVPMIALLVWLGVAAWDTEHWFYSSCMEITLLITAFLSAGSMETLYEK